MPKLAAVRLFAAVVLLSAVTSTIFAAGLASPAAASPAGWSSGSLIDPLQGDPISISCPTASFCAAVDRKRLRPHLRRHFVVVARQNRPEGNGLAQSRARRRASASRWTGSATSSPTTAARGRRPKASTAEAGL